MTQADVNQITAQNGYALKLAKISKAISLGNNNSGLAQTTLCLQGKVELRAYKAVVKTEIPKSEAKLHF